MTTLLKLTIYILYRGGAAQSAAAAMPARPAMLETRLRERDTIEEEEKSSRDIVCVCIALVGKDE